MKKIKMTPAELNSMRPSRSNVRDIFENTETETSRNGAAATLTYEMQKEIVELVLINEMLTSFLAS